MILQRGTIGLLDFCVSWLVDEWMELDQNKDEVVGEKYSGSNQLENVCMN